MSLIKDYFNFNRAERLGVITLSVIVLALAIAIIFYDRFFPPKEISSSQIDSLAQVLLKNDSLKQHQYKKDKQSFYIHSQEHAEKPIASTISNTKNVIVVELNKADSIKLLKIKGVGPVFAKRIIKYRELLGGYHHIQQLNEVYGIKPEQYELISSQVAVDTLFIKKKNINVLNFKELMRHPYIGFENAKLIMNYRNKVGQIKMMVELHVKNVVATDTYHKLLPYFKAE